jgi:hypothetical protein
VVRQLDCSAAFCACETVRGVRTAMRKDVRHERETEDCADVRLDVLAARVSRFRMRKKLGCNLVCDSAGTV